MIYIIDFLLSRSKEAQGLLFFSDGMVLGRLVFIDTLVPEPRQPLSRSIGTMAQATEGHLTEKLRWMVFRGPLARFRSDEPQVLPPLLALILEFAAFASLPLFFMGYLLLAQGSSSPVSPDLHGVWKTRAPGYSDRFMEITGGVIMFGTGGDTLESYVIEKVETEPDGTKTLYILTYLDKDRDASRLSFYYDPRGERHMTFKHQEHLTWTRVQE